MSQFIREAAFKGSVVPSLLPSSYAAAFSYAQVKQLWAFLSKTHSPITISMVAEHLGCRDFYELGLWIIRVRQSAKAVADARGSHNPKAMTVPIAHQTGGGNTTVIWGADVMELAIYRRDGAVTGRWRIPEKEDIA
ncbi:hypothetical protein LY76DRAFT_620519 [Colletotrichum caudatum]|nr:hypothetical protein LY76DRAFT_620519 [Colletotrichum caudatum]